MGLWDSILSMFSHFCSFFSSLFGGGSNATDDSKIDEAAPLVVTHGGEEEPQSTQPNAERSTTQSAILQQGDDDDDSSEVSSGSECPDEISNDDSEDDDDDDDEDGKSSSSADDKFSGMTGGRVRSGAFYDGSRPRISGGNIVKSEVPFPSTSVLLPKGGAGDGKDTTPGMRPSKRFSVGFADTIGRRSGMEDAHSVCGCFGDADDKDLFMIFDGHNGAAAAIAANERMPTVLLEALASGVTPEAALSSSFHTVHDEIIKGNVKGGCTATCVLFIGDKGYVAHVGDTRLAIIRDGMLRRLTIDHRPTNKEEAAAVRARGGMILFIGGPPRVNGMIAITRALGDRELHDALTCEPDVSPVSMTLGSDDVLVLACDGLWDSVGDDAVENIVLNEPDPLKAAEALRNLAYNKGSGDNISVMVIRSDK